MTGEVDLDNASAFLLGEQAGDLAGYAVAGGGTSAAMAQDLLIGAYENGDGGASAGAPASWRARSRACGSGPRG